MLALAQSTERDCDTRAANDDRINGGSCTRTKYTYDANGNVTERQGDYVTWASYNYPIYVYAGSGSTEERVDFDYGPDRKRWAQTYYNISAGSYETTDYIGGLFERIIGSAITGTIYRYYIYAGSEPIAVYARTSTGTNTFSYMLSDHQGSVSDLTSSAGTSTVNESFTPYGMRRNPATWSGAASNSDLTTAAGITRQAYTFQTQMGLWMGLNHMNGRVEDSMVGRFLSADPHIPDPTNTQSYNRYSYVNNNPLTQVDPTGFDSKSCIPGLNCPGTTAGIAGLPEQSGWSCNGNCGPGYANSPSGNWLNVAGTWINTGSYTIAIGALGTNSPWQNTNPGQVNVFFGSNQDPDTYLGSFQGGAWVSAGNPNYADPFSGGSGGSFAAGSPMSWAGGSPMSWGSAGPGTSPPILGFAGWAITRPFMWVDCAQTQGCSAWQSLGYMSIIPLAATAAAAGVIAAGPTLTSAADVAQTYVQTQILPKTAPLVLSAVGLLTPMINYINANDDAMEAAADQWETVWEQRFDAAIEIAAEWAKQQNPMGW